MYTIFIALFIKQKNGPQQENGYILVNSQKGMLFQLKKNSKQLIPGIMMINLRNLTLSERIQTHQDNNVSFYLCEVQETRK